MSRLRWDHFQERRSTPAVIVAGVALAVVTVASLVGDPAVTRHDALTIDAPVYAVAAPVPVGEPVMTTSPSSSVAVPGGTAHVPGSPTAATEYAELLSDPAVTRGAPIPGTTLPVPIRWGAHGSSIAGRCTQWEPLLAELAPPTGWDVVRMSRYMARESVCCPQVLTDDGWRTTQGGDRFDGDCNLTHIARWNHRSDAGLLQVNGINYDPARCLNTCLSVWLDTPVNLTTLGDPWLNVRAAARLCEFWVNAGRSCYQPWS